MTRSELRNLRDAFALIEKKKKNTNKRAVKMKGKFLPVRRERKGFFETYGFFFVFYGEEVFVS